MKKIKQKNTEYKKKQREKSAQSKGFSTAASYDFYSKQAKSAGTEKAKAKMRKDELKRLEKEAQQETMMGKTGKYSRVQKKVQKGYESFQKGAKVYNEVMGGFKELSGNSDDSFYPHRNTNQAYASGYGLFDPPKRKSSKRQSKKSKSKKAKPKKQESFWDQFY